MRFVFIDRIVMYVVTHTIIHNGQYAFSALYSLLNIITRQYKQATPRLKSLKRKIVT